MFKFLICLPLILVLAAVPGCGRRTSVPVPFDTPDPDVERIYLPPPEHEGTVSVEAALFTRKSRRSFSEASMPLQQAGQLLWAAQGLSADGTTGATRTAPSAGATHPLNLYLIAGNVDDLPAGIYRYLWDEHALVLVREGDHRQAAADLSVRQQFIAEAQLTIVLTAVFERTTQRYGERGNRYVYMEAGYANQNIYLQAEALGMGTVAVGAFSDNKLTELLKSASEPLLVIPVGLLP